MHTLSSLLSPSPSASFHLLLYLLIIYANVLSLNLPLTEARLFREASEERRSGKRRDCHCECCCTKAKADDGQDETTAKHRPQTEED